MHLSMPTAALGHKAVGRPAPDHQVAVIGLGYIGLPTAALLASYGWSVCGVDVSQRVVDTVNAGGVHIEERDLDKLVHDANHRANTGRLDSGSFGQLLHDRRADPAGRG